MADTQTQAAVLAGAGALGILALTVASVALAIQYGGVWFGVFVAGGFVAGVAAIGLYITGTVFDQSRDGRQERFR